MTVRHADAFDRLRRTVTFSGEAHRTWRQAKLAVIGAGLLGSRFVLDAVRSGARCDVYDPGIGEGVNLGTQDVELGIPKVETLARRCDDFAPGSVRAHKMDVLDVGEGCFASADLIVDASDDPGLEFPLSLISSGWGVPLVRLAVDGRGSAEMGRVLISHGGGGCACGICGASWREVFDAGPRTPCLGGRQEAAPTYAGSALAMSVVGLGLLCAQRLVGGNGADRVLNREFIVDLDQPQIHSMRLRRNDQCFTGHRRWDPIPVERAPGEITLRELIHVAETELSRHRVEAATTAPAPETVTVGLPTHPLFPSTRCPRCGETETDVGTRLRAVVCPRCGEPMDRRRDIALETLSLARAEALSIADRTCASLGFPDRALVQARSAGTPPIHLLLS